jgi:hypothetical protein
MLYFTAGGLEIQKIDLQIGSFFKMQVNKEIQMRKHGWIGHTARKKNT